MINRALILTQRMYDHIDPNGDLGPVIESDTKDTLKEINCDGVLIIRGDGMIGGSIGQSPVNRGLNIAYERVFYPGQGMRSLIGEFEAWGASQSANRAVMSCHDPRIGRIYEKLGYRHLESYYIKRI